jgi:hypothetical protein
MCQLMGHTSLIIIATDGLPDVGVENDASLTILEMTRPTTLTLRPAS